MASCSFQIKTVVIGKAPVNPRTFMLFPIFSALRIVFTRMDAKTAV
jgi:hypothetical protein